jgi:prepilin peptidase CpaA
MMETVMIIALTLVLAIAIWTDLRSGLLPNRLTFSAMGLALLAHGWMSGFQGMIFSLAGLGTGFGLFLLLYLWGGMGAGDVKLMAAVGAIVGAYGALVSGILAILVGGIYALGAMSYQWGFVEMCRRLSRATYGAILTGGKGWSRDLQLPFRLRYGLAIAAGTLLFCIGFNPIGG